MSGKTPVTLVCDACCAKLVLELDLTGVDPSEHWGAAELPAARRGWAIRRNERRQWCTCPTCLAQEQHDAVKELPAYSGASPCPKCGSYEVETHWCPGATSTCPIRIRREHLHRTCGVCGFDHLEETADKSPKRAPWWRRLLGILDEYGVDDGIQPMPLVITKPSAKQ